MRAQPSSPSALARQAREHVVSRLEALLGPLTDALRTRMAELADSAASGKDAQERRDALADFDRQRRVWQEGVARASRKALQPPAETARTRGQVLNLELIGDDVVENKILSSRLALAIAERASWELAELTARVNHLEDSQELGRHDVLRPEVVAQLLVEQWTEAGLARPAWALVQDAVHKTLGEGMPKAYGAANEFLIERGVLPEMDLASRVKRSPVPRRAAGSAGAGAATGGDAEAGHGESGAAEWSGAGGGGSGGSGAVDRTGGQSSHRGGRIHGSAGGVADETRMMTSGTPLARARMRASGVIGQLRRLLTDRAGYNPDRVAQPSPALADAIHQQVTQVQTQVQTQVGASTVDEVLVYDDAAVERVAVDLRERSSELKKKAGTDTEKATIEIVALMFQSILAEDRIPAAVRVWFARLQMPVLRVALAEPEFFGTLQHPARQLIDRMGSCVLGFDAASIGGSALELEIKRVVQVIEQYPETGRRVFQLVYDEFQKFLARFLTEKDDTQRLVSVAQQVEQKETMAIQYTIELRKMLNDLPVREEIREFLFKVWAEVLALAAVRHGPQHAETVALKKSAADLVWSASAKPSRGDRARVIQDLPQLLQRLRSGMTLLGIDAAEQERQIKLIGDTLADAFMSKTEAIPQAQIDAITERLANLEDFISDDPAAADLPLDADTMELMLGIDAARIEVVADGGSTPSDAMLAWARELQQGNWFTLDHNGQPHQVQYVWRSDRRQLHLFASTGGKSYLIQARRVAAYLQAGLLLPAEEETLTVRATRDALARLDANPERLLA